MNYDELKNLSVKYNIPIEDIILIALNRYGVVANTDENRIRMKLKLFTYPDIFYMAICVNTYDSPFTIKNNKVYLGDKAIAITIEIEKDTCDTTYFRRNKTEITLNSNARSQCKGCKFCGTYKLEAEDIYQLDTEEKLSKHIKKALELNDLKDLNAVKKVTVCTGCFPDENKLIEHLTTVKNTLKKFNFNNKIGYIGSQLKTIESLEKVKNSIDNFSLFITTECFENREKLMRNEKSGLTLNKTIELLDKANELGIDATILYILGIDNLRAFENNFKSLSSHLNKFPIVQILQNYTIEQEQYRIKEAKEIEYYLKARKILENIFGKTGLKPRSWENYRSLFYTKYNNKDYIDVRI